MADMVVFYVEGCGVSNEQFSGSILYAEAVECMSMRAGSVSVSGLCT